MFAVVINDIDYVRKNIDDIDLLYEFEDNDDFKGNLFDELYKLLYENEEDALSNLIPKLKSQGIFTTNTNLPLPLSTYKSHSKIRSLLDLEDRAIAAFSSIEGGSENCAEIVSAAVEFTRRYTRMPKLTAYYNNLITNLSRLTKKDEEFENNLRKLPHVPANLIEKSEYTFKFISSKMKFDIHDQQLNLLKGASVSQKLSPTKLKNLRQFEDYFVKDGCVLKSDAYVFRGLRLRNLNQLKNDPDSVTFVGYDIEKAMKYFESPAATAVLEDDIPLLMIIRLPKGVPIMRTRFDGELILPSQYMFKPYGGDPHYFAKYCKNNQILPNGQGGIAMFFNAYPTARPRVSTIISSRAKSTFAMSKTRV